MVRKIEFRGISTFTKKMKQDIRFRAKAKHYDPMVMPEDGYVEGFYYEDLCDGEIRSFIRNSELIWEVDKNTLEIVGPHHNLAMNEEDYVSSQVALLLKEKGYILTPCPTLYDVQQWLWNHHRLLVTAFLDEPFTDPYQFLWSIQDAKNDIDNYGNIISNHGYRNYQEALDAGICMALKTIKTNNG